MTGGRWTALVFALLASFQAVAHPGADGHRHPHAQLAIIIDDIGDNLEAGRRTVALPATLTLAFLPKTPHAASLAELAHARGHEVMLHLPMAAAGNNRLGPGALTMELDRQDLQRVLAEDLATVPHVRGVNNHMGSLLTEDAAAMRWLMAAMTAHGGLYFIDSRTTANSVAEKMARRQGLPVARRDVFIDYRYDEATVRRQMQRLVHVARHNGTAIGIAHPNAVTLGVLEELLPELAAQGVEPVKISALLEERLRRVKQWQASLSPSQKGLRNLKPSQ